MSLFTRMFAANLLAMALILITGILVATWLGGGAIASRWHAMAADNLRFQQQFITASLTAHPEFDPCTYAAQLPESGTVRGRCFAWPPTEDELARASSWDRKRLRRAIQRGQTPSSAVDEFALIDVGAPDDNVKLVLLAQPLPVWTVISKFSTRIMARIGLGVAIVLLITWLAVRHISRPIRSLHQQIMQYRPNDAAMALPAALVGRTDELGQLARGFAEMGERVRALVEARERLLLDVAHEMRSPLARQMLALGLLRSRPNDATVIEQLEREAERMDALLNDLTQISRAESGGLAGDPPAIALDQLIDDVMHDVRVEADARPCQLVWSERESGLVRGSYELLRRAVENVIRNAIRHTASGTAVEIALTRGGDDVSEVRVRDHGPGVAPEDLPRLFEPFFRTEPSRDRVSGGSGLGLAIADRAVRAHGGSAVAENANGGGLIVVIRLPRNHRERDRTMSDKN